MFGEATQVFHGDLMDLYFQVSATGKLVVPSSATISLDHLQFLLHILAHGGIALWVRLS